MRDQFNPWKHYENYSEEDMLEWVLRAAKMSRLPIPIQVRNLFVEAEDVTE